MHIKAGGKGMVLGPFLVAPSNRMRSNGHELKHKKFHLSLRKNFFTLRVAEYSYKMPKQLL